MIVTFLTTLFLFFVPDESKKGQRIVLSHDLVVEVITKAVVKKNEEVRIFSGVRKPDYIFEGGNRLHEDFKGYFNEEDIEYLNAQRKRPQVTQLSKSDFDKKVKIKLTNKEVLSRLGGTTVYIYHPMFSKDLKTQAIYYEVWSRDMSGNYKGQGIYKVFSEDEEKDRHMVQSVTELE